MRSLLLLVLLVPWFLSASAAEFQTPQREGTAAWAALVKPGKEAELAAAIASLGEPQRAVLAASGIGEPKFYTEALGSQRCLIATHSLAREAKPGANWADILRGNPEAARWLESVEACIAPHPRHANGAGNARLWASCETICQLRPDVPAAAQAAPTTHVAITGLRPEKEAEYRNLHDHVWPGVIAAIGDARVPRFDLYLIEFGDALYLIYSFDHVGTNFDADMAKMGTNPVNQRWWKVTDACQLPLPQTAKGIWEPAEAIPGTPAK